MIVDRFFGLLTYPTPSYGRTLAFPIIVAFGLGYRVKVRTPAALVTAVPVAEFAIAKTVELGTFEIFAKLKLKAEVDNPLMVTF